MWATWIVVFRDQIDRARASTSSTKIDVNAKRGDALALVNKVSIKWIKGVVLVGHPWERLL